MKRIDFDIPIYDWTVTIVTTLDDNCKQDVGRVFDELEIDESIRDEALAKFGINLFNAATTYTKPGQHRIFVLFYPYDNDMEFVSVMAHELRHMVDDIANKQGFMNENECTAYLTGFIAKEIYKRINEIR